MYTPAHQPTPRNTRHPGWHQPIPALEPTAPTAPPNTHHDMRPHEHCTEEEPPSPTQQPTPPATSYTRACHAWERGQNTHSKGIKEGVGGTSCARQREDRAREFGGRRLLCAPVGEKTLQVDIPRPKSRCWGEVPHRSLGMAAWTHLANGEGSYLPLCGLDTETGHVRGLRWHNLPRERKGKWRGNQRASKARKDTRW